MNAKPYRIVAFYDTETTNITRYDEIAAFPILHQLGITKETDLTQITPANVKRKVSVTLYRHAFELHQALDELPDMFPDVVPVVCVHNLGFDMYSLAPWLNIHDVKVLAKSSTKPITFTVLDDAGNPRMVLWDTLGFSMRGLAKMGDDCGIKKLKGSWDYHKIRTPETHLTNDEIAYAKHDIYVLAAWFGWYCRHNPDMEQHKLGLNIVTKTGAVRDKRLQLFNNLKGVGAHYNVGRMWYYLNREQLPKTDDELFTMHACMRGGFVFTASKHASKPYELPQDTVCAGFDAKSQHPAQMLSRLYPVDFKEAGPDYLEKAAYIARSRPIWYMLKRWHIPFSIAFNAVFEFKNLRLKKGSMYEKHGIASLAWSRIGVYKPLEDSENEVADLFRENMNMRGYSDNVKNGVQACGKLVSADVAILFLTEIEMWIMGQVYEWDEMHAIHGYATQRFVKPSDMSVLSVMRFYKAKGEFKKAMKEYRTNGTISPSIRDAIAPYVSDNMLDAMTDGTATSNDVEQVYSGLKSDLNSLYGIEATNETRLDCIIGAHGLTYTGVPGLGNLPDNPKAWYQFGQRIVGWSRVSQVLAIDIMSRYASDILNGDTDSIKGIVPVEKLDDLIADYENMTAYIDQAQLKVTDRVKRYYPDDYVFIKSLGGYEHEFSTRYYCAAWNKAYCKFDGNKFDFVFAGITTNYGERSYNNMARYYWDRGWSFSKIVSLMLGYNVTIDNSITGQNARKQPEWAELYFNDVTDYRGNTSRVAEPGALALYPMRKTVGGTGNACNAQNAAIALENNPNTNMEPLFLDWRPGKAPGITKLVQHG